MNPANAERMRLLADENKRRRDGELLAAAWQNKGVNASVLTVQEHCSALRRLKAAQWDSPQIVEALVPRLLGLVSQAPSVVVMDWAALQGPAAVMQMRPALRFNSSELLPCLAELQEYDPSGFAVMEDAGSKALYFDIDEIDGISARAGHLGS